MMRPLSARLPRFPSGIRCRRKASQFLLPRLYFPHRLRCFAIATAQFSLHVIVDFVVHQLGHVQEALRAPHKSCCETTHCVFVPLHPCADGVVNDCHTILDT